jgi:hypothetical protein
MTNHFQNALALALERTERLKKKNKEKKNSKMKTVSVTADKGKTWFVLCIHEDACAGWILNTFLNCF